MLRRFGPLVLALVSAAPLCAQVRPDCAYDGPLLLQDLPADASRQAQNDAYLERHYVQSLTDFSCSIGKLSPAYPRRLNTLAALYQRTGHPEAAAGLAERITQITSSVPMEQVENPIWIAKQYFRLGDYAGAEPFAREGLRRAEAVREDDPDRYLDALNSLAVNLTMQRKLQEAEAPVAEALALGQQILAPDSGFLALLLNNQGSWYRMNGEFGLAIDFYKQVLAIVVPSLGEEHGTVVYFRRNLAKARAADVSPTPRTYSP